MNTNSLHPLAAEVASQLAGETGPFMIFVYCRAQIDKTADFIAAFMEPLKMTVQEAGNFTYRLSQDVNKPENFVVVEHWQDLQALDAHLRQPYLETLIQRMESILAEPPQVVVMREHFPAN